MEQSQNIKDYLLLYFGSQILFSDNTTYELGISLYKLLIGDKFSNYKLLLRPLSDIKIEEAAHCLQQTFFDHVKYPMHDYRLTFVGQEKKNPRISIDNDWFNNSLTFGNSTGSIWCADNTPAHNVKLKASIFHYLIKQQFDMFGLINSGLAVDITTFQK